MERAIAYLLMVVRKDRRYLCMHARKHLGLAAWCLEGPLLIHVVVTVADLETLMRATLGALANFNEDEKMILVK